MVDVSRIRLCLGLWEDYSLGQPVWVGGSENQNGLQFKKYGKSNVESYARSWAVDLAKDIRHLRIKI